MNNGADQVVQIRRLVCFCLDCMQKTVMFLYDEANVSMLYFYEWL